MLSPCTSPTPHPSNLGRAVCRHVLFNIARIDTNPISSCCPTTPTLDLFSQMAPIHRRQSAEQVDISTIGFMVLAIFLFVALVITFGCIAKWRKCTLLKRSQAPSDAPSRDAMVQALVNSLLVAPDPAYITRTLTMSSGGTMRELLPPYPSQELELQPSVTERT